MLPSVFPKKFLFSRFGQYGPKMALNDPATGLLRSPPPTADSTFLERTRQVEKCREMPRNAEKCREMSSFDIISTEVEKCRETSRNVEKCRVLKISKQNKNFEKFPKFVKSSYFLHWTYKKKLTFHLLADSTSREMSSNVEKRREMPRNVEKCRVLSSPLSGGDLSS